MEKERTMAVFGGMDSNTGKAAQKHFVTQYKADRVTYVSEIAEVFQKVVSGECAWGVVPSANSYTGAVEATESALGMYQDVIKIHDQVRLQIQHCLMGVSGATLEGIREVWSHEQALKQCREWLRDHMGSVIQKNKPSTALAAEAVAQERDFNYAAIAPPEAARAYNLTILADSIGPGENETEFVLIGLKTEE